MKLAIGYSPAQEVSFLDNINSTWSRLGEGPWTGTVTRRSDRATWVVEELATSWKVTDETGRSSTGRDLLQLLERLTKPVPE